MLASGCDFLWDGGCPAVSVRREGWFEWWRWSWVGRCGLGCKCAEWTFWRCVRRGCYRAGGRRVTLQIRIATAATKRLRLPASPASAAICSLVLAFVTATSAAWAEPNGEGKRTRTGRALSSEEVWPDYEAKKGEEERSWKGQTEFDVALGVTAPSPGSDDTEGVGPGSTLTLAWFKRSSRTWAMGLTLESGIHRWYIEGYSEPQQFTTTHMLAFTPRLYLVDRMQLRTYFQLGVGAMFYAPSVQSKDCDTSLLPPGFGFQLMGGLDAPVTEHFRVGSQFGYTWGAATVVCGDEDIPDDPYHDPSFDPGLGVRLVGSFLP